MAFDNIKLEKGLYTAGKSFAQALEEIDPSDNYIGTELEGLDAYQRQLKRFDIKVSGRHSDSISKFFQTSDSATLFPEYVSRAVLHGLEEDPILDKIVATTTDIDALDYRSIEIAPKQQDVMLARVDEGAHIPETVIRTKERLTPLTKHGRMLSASYEAIKFQKLDLFTIMLNKIGRQIAHSQADDAIDAIFSSAPNSFRVDQIDYEAYIELWTIFEPSFHLDTIICDTDTVSYSLYIPQFQDSAAGMNFHATGNMITPLGAEVLRLQNSRLNMTLLGIDSKNLLEKVQAGGVLTEYDKLIDRQLDRAVISTVSGFSVMDNGAASIIRFDS